MDPKGFEADPIGAYEFRQSQRPEEASKYKHLIAWVAELHLKYAELLRASSVLDVLSQSSHPHLPPGQPSSLRPAGPALQASDLQD